MENVQLNIENSWREDHEEGMCTELVMGSPRTGGDGFYKRSYSAPPEERGRYRHIPQLLSQSQNDLKPQPLEISRRENFQAVLFGSLERCPLDHSKLSFRVSTEKDVDGGQPKMRETSSIEHKPKRKKRQHSPDLTSHESLEEPLTLPSNIENEGVATSCKRIKPNGPQTRKHHNIFESLSYSTNAKLREVLDDSASDSDTAAVGFDGDAPEQKILSGDGNATKGKSDFLARYRAGTNSYPDYGPLAGQTTVSLPPAGSKMMAGERKTGMPGSFRPVNTLQRNVNNSSVLPRPGQKKVFDLHENILVRASDEPRAIKRQKLGTEKWTRKESSANLVDISADASHVGTRRNTSSTTSTPKKAVQSVSSRSHIQSVPFVGRLGEVDEYQRTEAMIGFKGRKRRKVSDELERRNSFWVELDDGQRRQRTALISEHSINENQAKPHFSGPGKGKSPILIEDPDQDERIERSPNQKHLDYKNRKSTPSPELNERSAYFASPKRRSTAKNIGFGAAASSPASLVTTEMWKGEDPESPDSFQSFGNGVDKSQYLEDDSVDLVRSDGGSIGVDKKIESIVRAKNKAMKASIIPKSKSISQHGDIPQSAFSRLRSKDDQTPTGQTVEAELSFDITYMQSGPRGFASEHDLIVWTLQYDYEKKEFDILMDGYSVREKYPTLVLKPEKIHSVKYHDESLNIVIARAVDISNGAVSQVLVKMNIHGDGTRFAQTLKNLNGTIGLKDTESERLDRILNKTLKSFPITTPDSKDIALLVVKEARLAEKLNQPANIGRRRSSNTERASSTTGQKQTITNRMQSRPKPDASVFPASARLVLSAGDELTTSSRLNTQNGRDRRNSRPTTRASDRRSSEGQLQMHQSQSHSPIGWTQQNPHWKEEHSWKASLKFPMEAKKWTKVDAEDIERLDEGGFLNDNLVGFYLRYLQYMLEKDQPELARRIYFQNTYFYSTLMKGKVRNNNINYDAVKRWTTKDKVDIFSYDYIVVPVCEKVHWYVAIICNAPRLLQRSVPDIPDIPASTNVEDNTSLLVNARPNAIIEGDVDDCEHSGVLGKEEEDIEHIAASPSVITQVEHMSLEDQEWPEPDPLPDTSGSGIVRSRNLQITGTPSNNIIEENDSEGQVQKGYTRHKMKKSKRKSVPPTRKHDPHDPRIITLDSLGQAHSPTCSNLREYLVCEAQARRNVLIEPGRLGMTAKGLPEQSNYCDCGIFVLGYIERFLKDPDGFIHGIFQGDMAVGKAFVKFDASKMRGEIRELIFHLQADQLREHNARRKLDFETKEAPSAETQSMASSSLLVGDSSEAVKTEATSYYSTSVEPVLQLEDRLATSKNGVANKGKSLETRQPSSSVLSGSDADWAARIDLESINISNEEVLERSSSSASAPAPRTEDSEIMETPTPSQDDGFPVANEHISRDSSILLESPLHSDMLKSNWERSPDHVADAEVETGSKTHNIFKEFANNVDLSYQNTRTKAKHYAIEVSGSREELPLEVRETPPRKMQREVFLEEAREPRSGTRRSSAIVSVHDDDSDREVTSPFRGSMRKKGIRR